MQAFEFFMGAAGFCQHIASESEYAARVRCALDLAAAEARADACGAEFEWSASEIDSSEFCAEEPAWQLWDCACVLRGRVVSTLGLVDFGRDGSPWRDDYARIVEAELASELPEHAAPSGDEFAAALVSAFGEEFAELSADDRALIVLDFKDANSDDGCGADEYRGRIYRGNLASYVRTLRRGAEWLALRDRRLA